MTDPEELLDIKSAARLLGVSETSLRRWTNSGALPHLRIGGRRERRFRRSDLLAFLESPPGTAASRSAPVGDRLRFGGLPAGPGTHLCGLCTNAAARVAQAAHLLATALGSGCACLLVGPPKTQRAILVALARRVPSLPREIQAGRLIRSQYLAGGRAQLDYFENELIRARRAEGEMLCVVGDLADGGPERGKAFARLLEYEAEYDRRIARRFPVVTLCQYDARRLSGLDLLGALVAHPDAFRYPGNSVLA